MADQAKKYVRIEIENRQALKDLNKMAAATERSSRSLDKLRRQSEKLGTALKGVAALAGLNIGIAGLKDVIRATAEVEKLDNVLRGAVGAQNFNSSLDFLRRTAAEFGLSLQGLQAGYSNFAAAALGAGLSLEQSNRAFEGVAVSAAKFQLSTADLQGVLLGLQQLVGATNVNLEDLRQVLDRIPGGWKAATQAARELTGEVDLTMGAFKDLISQGVIPANRYVPLLARNLRELNLEGARQNADSFSAAMNRLNNAMQELYRTLAESGLLDRLTQLLNLLQRVARGAARAFGDLPSNLREALDVDPATRNLTKLETAYQVLEREAQKLNAALMESGKRLRDLKAQDFAPTFLITQEERRYGKLNDQLEAVRVRMEELRKAASGATEGVADTFATVGQQAQDAGAKLKGVQKDLSIAVREMIAAAAKEGINLTITSGFRSPEKNVAVGGAPGSKHLYGRAVDLIADNMDEASAWLKANADRFSITFPVKGERPGDYIRKGFGAHFHAELAAAARSVRAVDDASQQLRASLGQVQTELNAVSREVERTKELLAATPAAVRDTQQFEALNQEYVRLLARQNELMAREAELRGQLGRPLRLNLDFSAMEEGRKNLDDFLKAYEDVRSRIQALEIEVETPAERIARELEELEGLRTLAIELNVDFNEETFERARAELEDLSTLGEELGQTLTSSFDSWIDRAVDGTFRLQDALQELAKDLIKLLARMAAMKLFEFFGGAAGGGILPFAAPLAMPALATMGRAAPTTQTVNYFSTAPSAQLPSSLEATRGGVAITVNNNVAGARVEAREEAPDRITLDVVENYVANSFLSGGTRISRAAETAYPTLRRT